MGNSCFLFFSFHGKVDNCLKPNSVAGAVLLQDRINLVLPKYFHILLNKLFSQGLAKYGNLEWSRGTSSIEVVSSSTIIQKSVILKTLRFG